MNSIFHIFKFHSHAFLGLPGHTPTLVLVTVLCHYNDLIMRPMASQITGVSVVYSIVCSWVDQRKHQSSASLAFVKGIHQWPLNSPHKGPVTRKMFPFDDVIMVGQTRHDLGSVSQFDKTSYCKMSWNLEAARFVSTIVRSLYNSIGASATLL